jgi:hypothetical protein
MRNKYITAVVMAYSFIIISAEASQADTIVLYNPNANDSSGSTINSWGQSLTTPDTVSHNNITFNAFRVVSVSPFTIQPHAEGEVFILTQEYLETPVSLSANTPGYLSHTSTTQMEEGGLEWIFPPDEALDLATTYYFYARNTMDVRLVSQIGTYDGGLYYQSISGTNNYFGSENVDWHFELEGTPIPEPSRLLLGALAVVGLCLRRRSLR